MDGDVLDLPNVVRLCREYGAYLMVDEAHSVGLLGKTGRGIEEHFDLAGSVDIKMGTLSKTIPSVGGYVAGKQELIDYLRHSSRAYIFSAALPAAQAAAANESFKVILDETWRVEKLWQNTHQFLNGLKSWGFNTLASTTAIAPVLCGTDDRAYMLTQACQRSNLFVLPVVSPAVPPGLARLRLTVTAAHELDEIRYGVDVIGKAGKEIGIV
jgi:glycine C-acetyltransferase